MNISSTQLYVKRQALSLTSVVEVLSVFASDLSYRAQNAQDRYEPHAHASTPRLRPPHIGGIPREREREKNAKDAAFGEMDVSCFELSEKERERRSSLATQRIGRRKKEGRKEGGYKEDEEGGRGRTDGRIHNEEAVSV